MIDINDRIGMLTVLERKKIKNKYYYLCKCECGNTKWIRSDSLTKKNFTASCGCLSKNTQFKAKDITNNKYGKLTAIEPVDSKNKKSITWKCICECGNMYFAELENLTSGKVKSCGCLVAETNIINVNKAFKANADKNIKDNTNIALISRETPIKSNTSGVTGVRWDKSRNKWVASIIFKKKTYYLGRYKNKEDAIKARKEAEEKYFKSFLDNIDKVSK